MLCFQSCGGREDERTTLKVTLETRKLCIIHSFENSLTVVEGSPTSSSIKQEEKKNQHFGFFIWLQLLVSL